MADTVRLDLTGEDCARIVLALIDQAGRDETIAGADGANPFIQAAADKRRIAAYVMERTKCP